MAFVHCRGLLGVRYPEGTTFTQDQLLQIKPQHLLDWLVYKAFHKSNYSVENGDRPIHARASHIEQLKKGVSYFMPHQSIPWMNGQGNPTKHNTLRKLIAEIELLEVRAEGSDSKAKRAMTIEEFRMELKMLRGMSDYTHRVTYVAMTLWQYHLISRVDDIANFGMSNPKGHGVEHTIVV